MATRRSPAFAARSCRRAPDLRAPGGRLARVCLGLMLLVVLRGAFCAEPYRVVLLTGTDPIQPAALVQIRAVRNILENAPQGAEVFLDAIDGFRFGTENLTPEFFALMAKKYTHQRIDLVIGIGNSAADFALQYHARLWPDAPVLLTSVPDDWYREHPLPAGFASVPFRIDVTKTLAIAEALQPDAHRLVVLGGVTHVDVGMVERVVQAAASRQGRWTTVEPWIGLPLRELQKRLATLDLHTAVVFTTIYRDREGHRYFPVQLLGPVAAASRAPVYAWYSTYVGNGMTAGSIYDLEENGRMTGDAALSILREGGQIGATPFAALPTHCVADVTQMERFGLSTAALSDDCRLVNRPRSLFRDYRGAVWTFIGVLGAQSVSIVALLTLRRSRRLAEAEASARGTELARAARFATVGELSASIAHEVGQPLGAILSNADAAELIVAGASPDVSELQEILSDMKRDALRANDVVQRLRALLQKQAIAFGKVRIDDVVRYVLPLIEPEAKRRNIALDARFDAPDTEVLADQVQLQQVVLNLAINAMDAMQDAAPSRRTLTLSTKRVANGVELAVADRGCGIQPEVAERLFEPFFTTKPHGMGLGLSIVRSIVDAHRGRVTAMPRHGGGTTLAVWLPCARDEPAGATTEAPAPLPLVPIVKHRADKTGRRTTL